MGSGKDTGREGGGGPQCIERLTMKGRGRKGEKLRVDRELNDQGKINADAC